MLSRLKLLLDVLGALAALALTLIGIAEAVGLFVKKENLPAPIRIINEIRNTVAVTVASDPAPIVAQEPRLMSGAISSEGKLYRVVGGVFTMTEQTTVQIGSGGAIFVLRTVRASSGSHWVRVVMEGKDASLDLGKSIEAVSSPCSLTLISVNDQPPRSATFLLTCR